MKGEKRIVKKKLRKTMSIGKEGDGKEGSYKDMKEIGRKR